MSATSYRPTGTAGLPSQEPGSGTSGRFLTGRQRGVGLAIAAVVLVVAFAASLQREYSDRVFPGVRADGVALGGLSSAEAAARVAAELPALAGRFTLRDAVDERTWAFARADLGLRMDPTTVADGAFMVGRTGSVLARWWAPLGIRIAGRDVLAAPPFEPFDESRARTTLAALAPDVDVAPIDAELRLSGGELVDKPPVLGRQLDVDATAALLASLATNPETTGVDIVVHETAPRVYDVGNVGAAYRMILSAPLELVWESEVTRTIDVALLRRWAAVEYTPNAAGEEVPSITFDNEAMRRWVAPLAPLVERAAVDARFQRDPVTGRVSVLRPDQSGLRLDVDGTVRRIIDAAYDRSRTTSPAIQVIPAAVTDRALSQLENVVELTQAVTTLQGFPEGRLLNTLLALERFHGQVVPPGTEFSFNQYLGPVSAEAGYDITYLGGSDAVDPGQASGGLGGGIDQLATGALRAAFWAGLPISERNSPAYRVGWLEPPIGLDAAVDGAALDLRFVNDTAGPLLMQVTIDSLRTALVWALYGLPDDRRVETTGPSVTSVTPPRSMVERQDDRLPPGTRRQVGWAREGADVVLERIVSRAGVELSRDQFASHYAPWADVVLAGPRQ